MFYMNIRTKNDEILASFFLFFYFIAFIIMKCKVLTNITLTFHDKNIDMHDIRVTDWHIMFSPHVLREF